MTENVSSNKVAYWHPKAGNSIAGIIKGGGADEEALYDELKMLLLQEDNGAVVAVELNRYLIHSLKLNNVVIGDAIKVTFHGKEQINSGRSFNRYTLVLDKG